MIDPVGFIETLVNPETGRPFVLTEAEHTFLEHAFDQTPDGRMRYPELVFSGPKKTGKTALTAMVVVYVVRVLGGRFAEGYCIANDFEQAQGRVFQAVSRIVTASPALAADAKVTAEKVTFRSTGGTIQAIASDYAGAAGSNPTISCFDELWGVTSERGHRLFDELVPPPTRRIACRLTSTYAGFLGESELLEGLYNRGLKGEEIAPDLYAQPGMLMFWTHNFTAPWQTEEWREQMRQQLRPSAYLRLIENRWVSSESSFVEMAWWDECVSPGVRPLLHEPRLPVWIGVDASTKRDSTAIVACTYEGDTQRVRVVTHRMFQPTEEEVLDFESTVEATLLELSRRFAIREVKYDPYQMQAVAQRLQAARVPMVEFAQTAGNLTEASTGLYELVKARNLIVYADAAMRLAVQRSIAIETPRGWRIAKEKSAHKIDVVVALAMASLGTVQASMGPPALAHVADLLVDDRPVAMPKWCSFVHGVLVASPDGRAGIMYFSSEIYHGQPARARAVLLDFDDTSMADVYGRAVRRIRELFVECGGTFDGVLFVPDALEAQCRMRGVACDTFPKAWLKETETMAVSVGAHVADGRVKVAELAYEKSRRLPLGGALIFRGDADEDPLRAAWLVGTRLALGD